MKDYFKLDKEYYRRGGSHRSYSTKSNGRWGFAICAGLTMITYLAEVVGIVRPELAGPAVMVMSLTTIGNLLTLVVLAMTDVKEVDNNDSWF